MTGAEREGYIPAEGGRVWYRISGAGAGIPLLTLHGGPGIGSDYLEPLAALGDERPVVFYDQLGGGRSDRPHDDSLWTIDRFVRELAQVRAALGLGEVHILGQSWGTMLAVEHALAAAGVRSLVLADASLNAERWAADADALIDAMPEPSRAAIRRGIAAETYDAPDYRTAMRAFYRRHMYRRETWPAELLRSSANVNGRVYEKMWGPTDFYATGATKGYDRTPDLHRLQMPVLFACGRYDNATPAATAWYQSLVPGAEIAVFEESSHTPMNEEPEAFVRVVRGFLRRAEGAVWRGPSLYGSGTPS